MANSKNVTNLNIVKNAKKENSKILEITTFYIFRTYCKSKTIFSVVRYGNVIGSRGSVEPLFVGLSKRKAKFFPITDKDMTRFWLELDAGVDFVIDSFVRMKGGEIFIPKIPSVRIIDLAKSINSKMKCKIIGIRPGEKLHEQMIGLEDAPHTFEYDEYFKILPAIHNWSKDPKRIKNGKPVPVNFLYSSDKNKDWMTTKQLAKWISLNKNKIGLI